MADNIRMYNQIKAYKMDYPNKRINFFILVIDLENRLGWVTGHIGFGLKKKKK